MSGLKNNEELLGLLPKTLREELFKAYNEIVKNYCEGRWEPSELNGGKLCEIVYTILNGYISETYPPKAQKPKNFTESCRKLEQYSSCPRSIRIQIPRILIALYEIRNNRGVGHVGGDVDPNHMDAIAVLYVTKWIMAELIRVFHNLTTEKAAASVEMITERIIPVIWKIGDKYRVLKPELTMKEKTLLLVYQNRDAVEESQLIKWVEHSNQSVYRRDVLKPLHKNKLIEYDKEKKTITISPLGISDVENKIGFDL